MSTAPRQRVGRAAQEQDDATSSNRTSSHDSQPRLRRRRQKKSLILWEMIGASMLLLLLILGAPKTKPLFRRTKKKAVSNQSPSRSVNEIKGIPNQPDRSNSENSRPVLAAYLEPPDTLQQNVRPLPQRTTSASRLKRMEFPRVKQCSRLMETFPIDNFPTDDPFLPWIHDVFPTPDGKHVKFVAQNKRRCDTGKEHEDTTMKHWEPQISLFQPVPIKKLGNNQFRLASHDEADVQETRFLCRFHSGGQEELTLSEYPFNYEYVSWRKKRSNGMFSKTGQDMTQFWLSQLLFSCPVPEIFQQQIRDGTHVINDVSDLFVDVVTIRTPARDGQYLLTQDHIGVDTKTTPMFDPSKEWGSSHVLPGVSDSGRWANIPVCLPPAPNHHHLAACTWTSSSYTRRGDAVTLDDTAARLREWIVFHSLVGFDQLHVYDNSVLAEDATSELQQIANEFPNLVTYHRWPCQVCNNNRPANKNPGERSSQYAAEASCRERYGPHTDWMAFIDTDEYLVPMKGDTWTPVLAAMDDRGIKIVKMRSSRAKPRLDLMEPLENQSNCVVKKSRHQEKPDPCVVPRKDETFLRVYNCDFIRPPRPDRFKRAMKQIYKPEHVLSHFVHYSTVTRDVARLRKDYAPNEPYIRAVQSGAWQKRSPEVFLDELKEGILIHSRSVLPTETMRRSSECHLGSKFGCLMGFPCPDSVPFVDEDHKKNIFCDNEGNYCNCWINQRVEKFFIPKLEAALKTKTAAKPA